MDSISNLLPHPSTNYWLLKQCQLCGVPFGQHSLPDTRETEPLNGSTLRELPQGGPCNSAETRKPSKKIQSITCPECILVQDQHHAFPINLKGESLRTVVNNVDVARRGRREGSPLANNVLIGVPYNTQPETRRLLDEIRRIQSGIEWLEQCPILTLRVLQQRVLCASGDLIKSFLGVPKYMKPPDEIETPRSSEEEEGLTEEEKEEKASLNLLPPQPLLFSKFLSDFLLVQPPPIVKEEADSDSGSSREGKKSTCSHFCEPSSPSSLLLSGRAAPVAPISNANLVYGPQEDILFPQTSEAKENGSQKVPMLQIESHHQPIMNELMHWSTFFHHFFDPKKEGQCTDPISLYVTILLACARAGRHVFNNSLESRMEKEIEAQCLRQARTHCTRCRACDKIRENIKAYWRYLFTRSHASTLGAQESERLSSIRFFVGVPAVVWWAVCFLQLHRTTAAGGWKENPAAAAVNVLPAGEAFAIRDWIASEAALDAKMMEAQKSVGSLVIPSSCATNAKVWRVGFTQDVVQAAVQRITDLINQHIEAGTPVEVQGLKSILKKEFPVVAYYTTFFAPPVTCHLSRKRMPKGWVMGKGVCIRDPAVEAHPSEK